MVVKPFRFLSNALVFTYPCGLLNQLCLIVYQSMIAVHSGYVHLWRLEHVQNALIFCNHSYPVFNSTCLQHMVLTFLVWSWYMYTTHLLSFPSFSLPSLLHPSLDPPPLLYIFAVDSIYILHAQ